MLIDGCMGVHTSSLESQYLLGLENRCLREYFKRLIYFYFMCMICLSSYMYTHYMHAWYPQRQEWVLDPLELELQTIVSCHLDPGI